MKFTLSYVAGRRSGLREPYLGLVQEFVERSRRFLPIELKAFSSERELLEWMNREAGRSRPRFWIAESTGQTMRSEEFAGQLTRALDEGAQQIVFAVGPADGWSPAARERAESAVAFGRMTLPHELALVVAAEQVYRALTIRAGHPYHSGH